MMVQAAVWVCRNCSYVTFDKVQADQHSQEQPGHTVEGFNR
jgi:rubredoxin